MEDLNNWTEALQQMGDGVRSNGVVGLAMDRPSQQRKTEEVAVILDEEDVKWAK
jgi:hypothetical protein